MLLFADGFDAYGATGDLLKKWENINTTGGNISWGSTTGRFGGGGLTFASGTLLTYYLQAGPLTPNQVAGHGGVGFWGKFSAAPATTQSFLVGYGIGANNADYLAIASSGQLASNWAGTVAAYGPSVCDNQWHWIEYLWTTFISGNPSQPISIWLDGVQIANGVAAAPNIVQNGFQQFLLYCMNGLSWVIDDVIVADNQTGLQTGELIASSAWPLGPQKCETAWPNGAGSNTNWNPLSGANYSQVNENPPDGDTSYVAASASGIRDSYTYPAITGINPTATIVNVYEKNPDAGAINVQGLTYSGGHFGLGDSKLAPSVYQTRQFPIFRDPNTSLAWTKAGVNAAEFGVGVV